MTQATASNTDTIAAQATPPGRGGVGIIRISGPESSVVAKTLLGTLPQPRFAHYGPFYAEDGSVMDEGIALWFPGPNSFTGEDVLELQGHGGPVIMDMMLKRVLGCGIRMARPGEFSERAFLNDKMDLAQAEAIADLIDSVSEQAARNAVRSLQGAFSDKVHQLVDKLTHLRMYVEAAIDFPEEEIDFLADGKVMADLEAIQTELRQVQNSASQGALMQEGMTVVIAGRPNAGKSSLLNSLSGKDSAIVTDIAGTTRDVLREYIHIDGMPLHIVDTAGLRDTPDQVEQIGVERAWNEIKKADRVLLMVDSSETKETDPHTLWPEFVDQLPPSVPITVVRNKIDQTGETAGLDADSYPTVIRLCAKSGEGVDKLTQHLKEAMGYTGSTEGGFSARRRHLDALEQAGEFINNGHYQLLNMGAGELLAEDLRMAQQALGEITGQMSADDLLGKIFGSFCIGK